MVEEASTVTDQTHQLSRVFAALADPTRRDIVARLATRDATVGELAEPYNVSVQAVSKHLRVLEDSGLVSRTREAQRRPCHLEAEVFQLMTKWIERYRQEAEERFRRLDALLARMDSNTDGSNTDGSSSDSHSSDSDSCKDSSSPGKSSRRKHSGSHGTRSSPERSSPSKHHHPSKERGAS
jgi:DNA-binding transcriptional ArsR family regulator